MLDIWTDKMKRLAQCSSTPEMVYHGPNAPDVEPMTDAHFEDDPGGNPYTEISDSLPLIELEKMTVDQRIWYDIVDEHLSRRLSGDLPPQLLMICSGEGGVGKSRTIQTITQNFKSRKVEHILVKAAYTGIAASNIAGKTIHRIAMLSVRGGRHSLETKRKLRLFWRDLEYLIIDEMSMVSKELLAKLSRIIAEAKGKPDELFGGVNVCLCGDIHQFPPVVGSTSSPLYWPVNPGKDTGDVLLGGRIYENFPLGLQLRTQCRTSDPVWQNVLQHVRYGTCRQPHLDTLRSMILSSPDCPAIDFSQAPWDDAVLITPRHSVRKRWNSEMCKRECQRKGVPLFRFRAEDTMGGKRLTARQKTTAKPSKRRKEREEKGGLPDVLEVFVGMKVMVTFNVAVELDVANGSRGEVVDIVLDPREDLTIPSSGVVEPRYPPTYVLIRLLHTKVQGLQGLPDNVLPLVPISRSFIVNDPVLGKKTAKRKQLPLTAAYALTDYRGQGQTLYPVVIDIGRTPTGSLTPFNAYVALSRGRSRDSIRLLRDFEDKMFTVHASEFLRQEDMRLHHLDEQTRSAWEKKKGGPISGTSLNCRLKSNHRF